MKDVQEELWKVYDALDPEDKALKLKALELLCKMSPMRPDVKEERDPALKKALANAARGNHR